MEAKKRNIVIIFLLFVLCGCSSYKPLEVSNVKVGNIDSLEFDAESLNGVITITFDGVNFNRYPLEMTSCEAVIYRNDKKYGYASCFNPVVVEPYFNGKVSIPFSITVANPLTLISLGITNLNNLNSEEFLIDYDVTLKKGGAKKRVSKKNVPLPTLISMFENYKK